MNKQINWTTKILTTLLLLSSTVIAQVPEYTEEELLSKDKDAYGLFLEIFNFELSDKFNPVSNPFKRQQKRYDSVYQKLSRERRKQELRFRRSGGEYKESSLHKRLRLQLKQVEKEISQIYDRRLKADAIKLERIYEDIKNLHELIEITDNELKESAEEMLERYLEEAQAIIQEMIDNVIGHQQWVSNYHDSIPDARRKMYKRISKKVY